jgi:hypothetical protein
MIKVLHVKVRNIIPTKKLYVDTIIGCRATGPWVSPLMTMMLEEGQMGDTRGRPQLLFCV